MFLELDQPLRLKQQESGLQGIRKAQIKLACYYLAVGAEDRAQKIAEDMAGEDRERLHVDPRPARARRVQGVLGDHRPRPQLRVHAAEAEGPDGAVLRHAAGVTT